MQASAMRFAQWNVSVPVGLGFKFMQAFGETFRRTDAMEGKEFLRPVDDYYASGVSVHIKVSVHETEELKLAQFCEKFFNSEGILFKGPDVLHPMIPILLNTIGLDVTLKLKSGEILKGRLVGVGHVFAFINYDNPPVLPVSLDTIESAEPN